MRDVAIWLIETVRRTLLGTHQPLLFSEIATAYGLAMTDFLNLNRAIFGRISTFQPQISNRLWI